PTTRYGPTRPLPCTMHLIQCTLMSDFARCRRVNPWLAGKRWFWALPGRAGDAVVEMTVDHTLMRGSEPHDRCCVAELPRSRNLHRTGDPADSGCEGSPDRGRAASLARK